MTPLNSKKPHLWPNPKEIRAKRKRLPQFEPYDVTPVLNELLPGGGKSVAYKTLLQFRRHSERQLIQLLRHLEVDPAAPDAWLRGFSALASYYHGVGHLTWRLPRRANKNAATWNPTQDIELLMEVRRLRAVGLSERAAIKKIVSDPKTRRRLPYREQRNRSGSHSSRESERRKREAAAWRRLQHLKALSRKNSLLKCLTGQDSKEPNIIVNGS